MTAHPFQAQALKIAGIALTALLLAACGAKEDDKKAATQAAARVNGAEITVHQINQILGRLPGISEETAPKARQEILGKLIDQQLAVEQAIEMKLDRQPEVMAALEAARREVLARVYLEQAAAAKGRPTPEEGKKYYDEHPELFAQRRIYNLREITVEKNEALMSALREKLAAAKSMDEVAAWLKQKEARFSAQGGVRPAEQIPLDLLGSLHKMKDGQTTVFDTPRGIVIVQVAATQQAPVDEKTAMPRIMQFLANQRSKEVVDTETKALRDKAKIEYLGDFAAAKEGAAPVAAAPAAPPAPSAETGNVGKAIGGLK